jgi:hypothetical protein
MDDKLNGRRVVLWQDDGDPYRNLETLAVALTTSAADLFNRGDRLVWLKDGEFVQVGIGILAELIRTYVVVKGVRNTGTPDEPDWTVRFTPFEPSEMMLRALIRTGKLENRVPKISELGTPSPVSELPRSVMLELATRV